MYKQLILKILMSLNNAACWYVVQECDATMLFLVLLPGHKSPCY